MFESDELERYIFASSRPFFHRKSHYLKTLRKGKFARRKLK